ncbi:MAG: hypothetical protein AB1452_07490, partial [Pseudomonadota bacterium]
MSMTDVAIIAAPRDGEFVNAVRELLRRAGIAATATQSMPAQLPPKVVVLWSADLERTRSVDAQSLVGLWSEGRLAMVRRDQTALPLGMRDLPSLPPETTPDGIRNALGAVGPKVLRSKPESEPATTKPAEAPKAKSPVRPIIGAVLAVMLVGGGAYYYLTAEQRAKQAELTARLEAAAKASEDLNKARQARVEAQKKLAEARAAELEAIKRGDKEAVVKLGQERKRAEAETAKQVEIVQQSESARQKTIDDARKAQEAAKHAKAEP